MSLGWFVLALAARAAFELARGALVNMRKARLLDLESRNRRMAVAIRTLNENSSRLLATADVGTTLGTVAAGGVAIASATGPLAAWLTATILIPAEWATPLAWAIVIPGAAFLVFMFGRLLPEAVAVRYAERIAIASVWPMRVCSILFAPMVRAAVVISNWLSLPFGATQRQNASMVTEAEIITMVDASQEGGLIEQEEKAMILSVLDLSDKVAREVMVPRIDVQAISLDSSFDQALEYAVTSGHSRIPVYQESVDHIVGVLFTKDLLRLMLNGERPALKELVRDVHFTVESKRISELLQELQSRRMHLCVVVDEFGGTAGVVTIEDILEEIVGEIHDEYDEHEDPEYVALPDESGYLMDAGMPIDDVNDLLGLQLPTDHSDTLGGFIYDQLGEVPDVGAVARHEPSGMSFEVVEVNDRRILKVKALRNEKNHASESEAAGVDRQDNPAPDPRREQGA